MGDHLLKVIGDGVRMYAAITTDLVNEGIQRHDCYPVAAAALGRTMTGALLFAANLKNKEASTIKFAGDGPLGTVVADATPEGYVRGYVEHPHTHLSLNKEGKLDVGGGIGNGFLTVTRFTGLKDPISGSIEIDDGEIANDLTRYLYLSEQTPSSVGLGVLISKEFNAVGAGGFLIQPLPDATEEQIAKLEENLSHVGSLSHRIAEGLDAEGMVELLLDGLNQQILSRTELSFRCNCSKERVAEILIGLGDAEIKRMMDEGCAEVQCHFCNEQYEFTREELKALLADGCE